MKNIRYYNTLTGEDIRKALDSLEDVIFKPSHNVRHGGDILNVSVPLIESNFDILGIADFVKKDLIKFDHAIKDEFKLYMSFRIKFGPEEFEVSEGVQISLPITYENGIIGDLKNLDSAYTDNDRLDAYQEWKDIGGSVLMLRTVMEKFVKKTFAYYIGTSKTNTYTLNQTFKAYKIGYDKLPEAVFANIKSGHIRSIIIDDPDKICIDSTFSNILLQIENLGPRYVPDKESQKLLDTIHERIVSFKLTTHPMNLSHTTVERGMYVVISQHGQIQDVVNEESLYQMFRPYN